MRGIITPLADFEINKDHFIVHEHFNATTRANDICLLKAPLLHHSGKILTIEFNKVFISFHSSLDFIQKIKLPPILYEYSKYYGMVGTAASFGVIELCRRFRGINVNFNFETKRLDYTLMRVLNKTECSFYYDDIGIDEFCAVMVDTNDACIGEPGTALVIQDESENILIGLQSFKFIDRCHKGHPSVFIRVANHLVWIQNNSNVEYFSVYEVNLI